MYQLVIKNALIVDGSGQKPHTGDVAIEDGKIVAVNRAIDVAAKTVVGATGLCLAPGFIDSQNHSDAYWQLFANPNLHSLVAQGYTSIIVGNSGTSLAPLISKESLSSVQKWQPTTGLNVNWRTFAEYAEQLSQLRFGSNVASLVGYSTLRRGLIGDETRPLTREEIDTLLQLVTDCFEEGALGLSVGLQYSHELTVSDAELVALAELCAAKNKIMAIGLRNEAADVVTSTRELCALAEQTGVNLKISHLKIRYSSNWPLLSDLLDTIEASKHRGANIHFDCYPYTATWQPLYTYLPYWSLEGGRTHLLERLKDPVSRERILSALNNHPANLAQLTVASTANRLKVNGKTISSIAKSMGLTSEQTILSLVENGGSATLVFDESLDTGMVNILCNHALSFIATNGGGFDFPHTDQLVHPRSFGTTATFLRQVIDSKAISLEEAIAKMTSRPAQTFGLKNKGEVRSDFDADLVLFNPKEINSQASTDNPYQYPVGIEAVWVNGQLAAQKGRPTGELAGRFIK